MTWTASDGAGNSSSCTQSVTVQDNELPMVTCPADITVTANPGECDVSGINLGSATSSDNCSVQSETNDGMNPYGSGQTLVTWTVVDGSGNSNTCVQTVQVNTDDTESPMVSCPTDITVDTDSGICTASGVNLGSLTSSDNCGVVSEVNDSVEPYSLGVTIVTWTASDGAGNSSSCTQSVTVQDNELPMIICPADITVSANPGECDVSGINLGSATSSDNCSVQSETNDGMNPYGSGQTLVTWTVVDGSGNSNTCVQTVQVNTDDTESPMVSCPTDITVDTDSGICTASGVNLGSLTSSDNCGVVSEVNDSVEPYSLGVTVVTWTASDGAGNSFVMYTECNGTRQ